MARTIGSYEAKTRFAELIREANAGEEITITNHGKPVARIVPPEAPKVTPVEEVVSTILRLRDAVAGHNITAKELKEAIENGRA